MNVFDYFEAGIGDDRVDGERRKALKRQETLEKLEKSNFNMNTLVFLALIISYLAWISVNIAHDHYHRRQKTWSEDWKFLPLLGDPRLQLILAYDYANSIDSETNLGMTLIPFGPYFLNWVFDYYLKAIRNRELVLKFQPNEKCYLRASVAYWLATAMVVVSVIGFVCFMCDTFGLMREMWHAKIVLNEAKSKIREVLSSLPNFETPEL